MNRKSCEGCIYYGWEYSGVNQHICNYNWYTGELRDCPAEHCTKKKTSGDLRPVNYGYYGFDSTFSMRQYLRALREKFEKGG